MAVHLGCTADAVATLVDVLRRFRHLPLRAHVQQVHEEVVGQRAGPVGEDAVLASAVVGAQGTQAADQDRQLGSGQVQHVGPVHQQPLHRRLLANPNVVAEAVGLRFEPLERVDVSLFLRCVGTPRRERNRDVVAGILGRLLDSRGSRQHDHVGKRDLLPAGQRTVEVLPDLLEDLQRLGEVAGLVGLPVLLWRKANPRPVGPATHVGAAEG